jgi:hypothetical protein
MEKFILAYLILFMKFKINRNFNYDLNFVHQFFFYLLSFIILYNELKSLPGGLDWGPMEIEIDNFC